MTDFKTADAVLQSGVDDGIYTHAACRVAVGGETVLATAFGKAANEEFVFDIASLTKPLSTATLLLQCVERGEIHLGEKASTLLEPAYGPLSHLKEVTVEQLATHASGLPAVPRLQRLAGTRPADRTELMRQIVGSPAHNVGYRYSDTGYILLGEIISIVTGEPLDALFRTRIAEPAGLKHIGYLPTTDWAVHVAPTSGDQQRTTKGVVRFPEKGGVSGVVHDPRARELGGVAGHAGLFAAAADVLRLVEIIRSGGVPLLSPASVARMAHGRFDPAVVARAAVTDPAAPEFAARMATSFLAAALGSHATVPFDLGVASASTARRSPSLPAIPLAPFSVGWFCCGNDLLPSGDLFSPLAFGHSGFTGVMALIDPIYDASIVLLTNRVINEPEGNARYLRLRRRWVNTVAASVSRIAHSISTPPLPTVAHRRATATQP